jgi:hypothetical protein
MAGNVSYYKIILCVTLSKVQKISEMTTQKTVSNYEKFNKVIRIHWSKKCIWKYKIRGVQRMFWDFLTLSSNDLNLSINSVYYEIVFL